MSLKVLTWAFGLTVEPRAKICLLAIADNADDDGVAWPSRDLIGKKSSQSRATVIRRLTYLVELGVIRVVQRFRPDGSQTTDEIHIDISLSAEEVMRRAQALKAALKAGNKADFSDETDEEDAPEVADRGCQPDTPPIQPDTPGVSDVTPPGYHCGNPHNEPSIEPDRIGDARARPSSLLTDGSKALASAFWKALGINRPLDVPHQLAGIDHRAVMWEQHGWDVDLIEAEARRFAGDDPPKPISYFEKCFATAFAKRQAPLPVVEVRPSQTIRISHHAGHQGTGSGIIQAADRLNAAIDAFDEGPGSVAQGLCSQAGSPAVRLLPQG